MKSYEIQFIKIKNRLKRQKMSNQLISKIIKKDVEKGIYPQEFLLCLKNPPQHAPRSKSNPNPDYRLPPRPDGKTDKRGYRLAHYCARDYQTSPCKKCVMNNLK